MSNSKTLIEIQDLTDISVGVSESDHNIHILIGAPDEHRVEIVGSVRTMCDLASSVVDLVPDRVADLQRELDLARAELAKWVNTG